jgi:hypothetical protein
MAVSLAAQTLTVGTGQVGNMGVVSTGYVVGSLPMTPAPTLINVTLASQGAQIASLQFDLAYDTTNLTITVAAGSSATAAGKSVTTAMGPECSSGSGCTPLAANAQRVIIAGGSTSGGNPSVFADGVVATLAITVANTASAQARTLTLSNMLGSNPSDGAVSITGVNGTVNWAYTYLVGDVYPYTSNTAPNFGVGSVSLQALIQMLFAVNLFPGYTPAPCTDRFDAMDTYPADTATTRGGDGTIGLQDLILELFRETNLNTSRPVRPSYGAGVGLASGCVAPEILTALHVSSLRAAVAEGLPISGALVLEAPLMTSGSTEQVPVYLEAARDMVNVAVTFGLGDQLSQLHFVPAGAAPSLVSDDQPGAVAAAWLQGVTIPAGGRLLLGYVTGPAGMNLKVYGTSASGLDDGRDVRLGVSTRTGRQ